MDNSTIAIIGIYRFYYPFFRSLYNCLYNTVLTEIVTCLQIHSPSLSPSSALVLRLDW